MSCKKHIFYSSLNVNIFNRYQTKSKLCYFLQKRDLYKSYTEINSFKKFFKKIDFFLMRKSKILHYNDFRSFLNQRKSCRRSNGYSQKWHIGREGVFVVAKYYEGSR